MQQWRRFGYRTGAALIVFALVSAACAADESGSAEVDGGGLETATSANQAPKMAIAGGGVPHSNMQPAITLTCIIALEGIYPSGTSDSLRHGVSSAAATGEPALSGVADPWLGEIAWVAYKFAPRGWALCDGQFLPIWQYESLFSLLGNRYGGDGKTTFALPDVRGRTIVHEGAGTGLTERVLGTKFGTEEEVADLASHTHGFTGPPTSSTQAVGAHNNMQPSVVLNCVISTAGVFPERGLRRQIGEEWLGEVKWVPYDFAPNGWEFCDGQSKDISDSKALFALILNTFGGDGTTTFSLPDARGRTFVHAGASAGSGLTARTLGSSFGSESVSLTENQLPSHAHESTEASHRWPAPAGLGQPHENMQPSIALNCVISIDGQYPSRSLRHGVSSSSATGEPTVRLSNQPGLGEISWVPYDFAPRGWAFCDGESLPIAPFEALFSLISTTYGGNGRTDFGLPDLRGRTPVHLGRGFGLSRAYPGQMEGQEAVALTVIDMPSHVHSCEGGTSVTVDALDVANSDLRCANLATASFTGADFTNTDLSHSEMYAVDLTGATMTNALLLQSELTEANLTGANLTGANFTGASMYNTNLTEANLTGAIFAPAEPNTVIWSNTTCPDGSNSDTNGRSACP